MTSRATPDLVGRLRAAPLPSRPASIELFGVVTKDRPQLLSRCLASFSRSTRARNPTPRLVVADGGEETSLAASREFHASYIGPNEKRAFLGKLASLGAPAKEAEFALFGLPNSGANTGANRNALLLEAVGEPLLCADDDMLCRLAASPDAASVECSSAGDPLDFRFFNSRSEALAVAKLEDLDPFALHEAWLGKSVAQALDSTSRIETKRLSPTDTERWSSTGARIALTLCGIAGDSGMGSPFALWFLDGDSRARQLADESAYRRSFGRGAVRTAPRTVLSSSVFCMAAFAGLDAREPLPPFMPNLRNQDGIFGLLLRACLPDSCRAFLPYAIAHDPEETRAVSSSPDWGRTAGFRFCDVLLGGVRGWVPPAGERSPERLFAHLGARLLELGLLSEKDFAETVRKQELERRARMAALAESSLSRNPGAPAYWKRDLEQLARELQVVPAATIPEDLAFLASPEAALQRAHALVESYARLLTAWPAILQATRELKDRGAPLARRV